MNIQEFMARLETEVAEPMRLFMRECGEDAEYTDADIDACCQHLAAFLTALNALAAPTDEAIMAQVEAVVLALNALNEATDYALIETSERENICMIIQDAAQACGLQADVDDVTEAWREW